MTEEVGVGIWEFFVLFWQILNESKSILKLKLLFLKLYAGEIDSAAPWPVGCGCHWEQEGGKG